MGHFHALFQRGRHIGGIKRGPGVKHDHVGSLLPVLALAPAQRIPDQCQRALGVLDIEADQALTLDTEILGLDAVLTDLAVLQLGDMSRRRQADLVQPILRVHHQHMLAVPSRDNTSAIGRHNALLNTPST